MPVEKAGDVNPLLEAARNLGDDNDDSDENTTESDRRGEADNGIGSYERFMTTFGNPSRWAGR